jgi:hypothetical protein
MSSRGVADACDSLSPRVLATGVSEYGSDPQRWLERGQTKLKNLVSTSIVCIQMFQVITMSVATDSLHETRGGSGH